MNYEEKKLKNFKDLHAWQEGHALVLGVYKITKGFPKEEIFGLVNQMRRSAVSVTSNIAEGFGRKSYKEKLQFYYVSQSSIAELQSQLLVAKDVGYTSEEVFGNLEKQSIKVHKIVGGLIKSTKVRIDE